MPERDIDLNSAREMLRDRYDNLIENLDNLLPAENTNPDGTIERTEEGNLSTETFMEVMDQSGIEEVFGEEVADDVWMFIHEYTDEDGVYAHELIVGIGDPPSYDTLREAPDYSDNDGNARISIPCEDLDKIIISIGSINFKDAYDRGTDLLQGNADVSSITKYDIYINGEMDHSEYYVGFSDGHIPAWIDTHDRSLVIPQPGIYDINERFEPMIDLKGGEVAGNGRGIWSAEQISVLTEQLDEKYSNVIEEHRVDINYDRDNFEVERTIEVDGQVLDNITYDDRDHYNPFVHIPSTSYAIAEIEYSGYEIASPEFKTPDVEAAEQDNIDKQETSTEYTFGDGTSFNDDNGEEGMEALTGAFDENGSLDEIFDKFEQQEDTQEDIEAGSTGTGSIEKTEDDGINEGVDAVNADTDIDPDNTDIQDDDGSDPVD